MDGFFVNLISSIKKVGTLKLLIYVVNIFECLQNKWYSINSDIIKLISMFVSCGNSFFL